MDNSVLTLGNKKVTSEAFNLIMTPKERIKIYIWLNDKNLNTHPLYYLKKTHKQILNWKKYEDTRFPKIDKKSLIPSTEIREILFFLTHMVSTHILKKQLFQDLL